MKNGKLQIGLIGIGGIANQKHMPSLSQMKDLCELVAFCDIIKERAEAGAKEFGAPGAKVYTDYKELLADDSIDGGPCADTQCGSRADRGGRLCRRQACALREAHVPFLLRGPADD